MKAYIIHLPRATRRGIHIAEQMAAAGLDHTYVDVVDGHDLTEADYETLVDREAVTSHPTWLTPGMLGASLSHYRAYEQIIADGAELAVIIEDDAILPPAFKDLLSEVADKIRGKEVVLLYYRSSGLCDLSDRDAVAMSSGAALMHILSPDRVNSAAAYVITLEASASMRDLILPVRAGPDSWGFFQEHGALDAVRCIFPRPVGVRNDFKSSIAYFPADSLRQRISTAIADHRIFPFFHVLAAKRRIRETAMSRFRIVRESELGQ